MNGAAFLALCALGLTVAACERERRPFEDPGSAARRTDHAAMTPLVPGSPPPGPATAGPFRHNAYGISEGKRLFASFNCVGCHSHGGGGMGPALMDDEWIYGSHAENIFNSILEGRPNGMPAWRGKIPDEQVWQIVAYVQSMNGQEPIDVLPGRDDHLRSATPENLRPAVTPVQTGAP